MASSRKQKKKTTPPSDNQAQPDEAKRKTLLWMVGRPEPSLEYVDGLIGRWWQVAGPVIIVFLLLYFWFGP